MKLKLIMLAIFLLVLFGGCTTGSPTDNQGQVSTPSLTQVIASPSDLLVEDDAIDSLVSKFKEYPDLFSNWISGECIGYTLFDSDDKYSIKIHENHSGDCPGDPNVAPALAFFDIDKQTKAIYYIDMVEGAEQVPFDEYLANIDDYYTSLRVIE